ncbi:MAG TPA: glycosyltransferase [Candidatus Cloacimonadota bacterium]|nr:glycosyltransferase [Candidatus Cloacimonadota bacterium]HOD53261.1 glycosyltransferase [Candidatus Cloacimonadota bacterium]
MFLLTAFISIFIYCLFIVVFYANLKRHEPVTVKHQIPVSIVCSARNEEDNLPHFLNALLKQQYDLSLVQIIIADDCSSDRTAEILKTWSSRFPDFSCFTAQGRNQVLSAKKNALGQAIQKAKYNILLSTDADCIPQENWINGMVDAYVRNEDAEMVVGFSETELKNDKLVNAQKNAFLWFHYPFSVLFEHFDFMTLMFATSASVNAGLYFSCSGQNLSFRKSAFNDVGGYEPIKQYISGDDLHLMQLFKQHKKHIVFANNSDGRVKTKAITSLYKLFNQRSRWASNMKFMVFSNPLFFVYLLSVFFVLTLIPALLFLNFSIGVLLFSLKIVMDSIFIQRGYKDFQLWSRMSGEGIVAGLNFWTLMITWSVFQPVYTMIVAVSGFFSLFKWKDRKGFKK